jgi:predicted GNAT family acetyltransferase
MAGFSGSTPNGARVNLVYTKPGFRGKGYASSLAAEVSQGLLNEGKKFCVLFADLANPVSNGIYQKIGYQTCCDWNVYSFDRK